MAHGSQSSDYAHSTRSTTDHTMTGNIEDDEYVANLLKQDAKNATKKYDLVGIDAFNPRRCVQAFVLAMPLLEP
jgi:hypothetical protein